MRGIFKKNRMLHFATCQLEDSLSGIRVVTGALRRKITSVNSRASNSSMELKANMYRSYGRGTKQFQALMGVEHCCVGLGGWMIAQSPDASHYDLAVRALAYLPHANHEHSELYQRHSEKGLAGF